VGIAAIIAGGVILSTHVRTNFAVQDCDQNGGYYVWLECGPVLSTTHETDDRLRFVGIRPALQYTRTYPDTSAPSNASACTDARASRLALGLVVVATGLVLLATLIIAAVPRLGRRRRPGPPLSFPPPDFVPYYGDQPRDQ